MSGATWKTLNLQSKLVAAADSRWSVEHFGMKSYFLRSNWQIFGGRAAKKWKFLIFEQAAFLNPARGIERVQESTENLRMSSKAVFLPGTFLTTSSLTKKNNAIVATDGQLGDTSSLRRNWHIDWWTEENLISEFAAF